MCVWSSFRALALVGCMVVAQSSMSFAAEGDVTGSAGSSIVLGPSGPLLTNAHVVEACSSIEVFLPSGHWVPGTVRRLDPEGDMAIVDAPISHGVTLRLRGQPDRRESIWVAGHPGGSYDTQVVEGAAGALGDHTTSDVFPVSAHVESGDSGGPVFDGFGNVVGMSYAGANDAASGYAIVGWRMRQFLAQAGIGVAVGGGVNPVTDDVLRARASLVSLRILCYRGLPQSESRVAAEDGAIQAPQPVSAEWSARTPLQSFNSTGPGLGGIEPAAVAPQAW